MDTLQKALQAHLAELPRQLLDQLFASKLKYHGLKLSRAKRAELVERVLTSKADSVTFTSEGPKRLEGLTIAFTDEDLEWLDKRLEATLEELPDIVNSQSDPIAGAMLKELKRRWPKELLTQQREIGGFRKRLMGRWKRGLGLLRMLLTIAREFGDGVIRSAHAEGKVEHPKTFGVLVKLHVRACQVTDEILCLLEGGFADGAMARWRTLHEIAAVALLISEHGEELAERYLAHDIVESRRGALQYLKHHARLNDDPPTEEELKEIEAAYQVALKKYGADFSNQQGWAAKHLGKGNPSMADIQEASKIDHLGPYYRMASHNVHANPKGILFKLGLIRETNMLPAGPSNAGLTDPGHSAAISLVQVSSTLIELAPMLDTIVQIKMMQKLMDEIGPALLLAQRKLEADDEKLHQGAG